MSNENVKLVEETSDKVLALFDELPEHKLVMSVLTLIVIKTIVKHYPPEEFEFTLGRIVKYALRGADIFYINHLIKDIESAIREKEKTPIEDVMVDSGMTGHPPSGKYAEKKEKGDE